MSTNVWLYLNFATYPYDDPNLDFDWRKYAVLYDMYAKFHESYYGYERLLLDITCLQTSPRKMFKIVHDRIVEYSTLTNVPEDTFLREKGNNGDGYRQRPRI